MEERKLERSATIINGIKEQEKRKGRQNSKMVWFGKVNGGNKDHGTKLGMRRDGGEMLA